MWQVGAITVTSREHRDALKTLAIRHLVQEFAQAKNNKIYDGTIIVALCGRNPPVTNGFPSQRASNAQEVSMSCCHCKIPFVVAVIRDDYSWLCHFHAPSQSYEIIVSENITSISLLIWTTCWYSVLQYSHDICLILQVYVKPISKWTHSCMR